MSLTRRETLAGALAFSALPSIGAAQRATPNPNLSFFSVSEARFLDAAIDRLIPAEPDWPGARDAAVLTYIDLQLAGPFGEGARFFNGGPHEAGTPEQGYQLPYTPAELYRRSMRALLARTAEGRQFIEANDAGKDAFLTQLETGEMDLEGVPSSVFFETLLTNTIEGYFADPVYGGNRDMTSWRMIGFPGAHAGYLGIYTQHGIRFDRPPLSIGDSQGHRHGHGHGQGHGSGRAPAQQPAHQQGRP
jgi:gluconate 2-dehydrogenase gamma chain